MRPAKMFRRWDSEQSTASAIAEMSIRPLAQRSIGCKSLMLESISTRNMQSQTKRFLWENTCGDSRKLKCGMGKLPKRQYKPLFVGDWIDATGHQQNVVAKAAGVSQSYISNLSGGRRSNPSAFVLKAIADQIGVAMDDFYMAPPAQTDMVRLRQISARARESLHQAWARSV